MIQGGPAAWRGLVHSVYKERGTWARWGRYGLKTTSLSLLRVVHVRSFSALSLLLMTPNRIASPSAQEDQGFDRPTSGLTVYSGWVALREQVRRRVSQSVSRVRSRKASCAARGGGRT